ncbi:MAG: MFS transporter [Planctomycetes bacterium]|nr:MFS transporter [Planctomycetota bacterium]
MNSIDLRNLVLSTIGECLWGLNAALVSSATVLPMLLRRFNAGDECIGAIQAVEAGGVLLPQILGAYIFHSRKKLKKYMVLWHFATMIPFLFCMAGVVFVSPWLPDWAVWTCLLGFFALFMVSMGIVAAAWLDWVAHIFRVEMRGTALGLGFCGASVAGVLGGLIASRLIGDCLAKNPAGNEVFGLLYLLAGGMAGLSILTFAFIYDPGQYQPSDSPRLTTANLVSRIRESLSDPNYRRFLVGRLIAACGFCMMPFVAVYYHSGAGGGLDVSTVVLCGVAFTAGQAISSLLLGRLGDRLGHRLGVLVGACTQVAALGWALAMPGVAGCAAVYLLAGIVAGSGLVSHINMMFETCPHRSRIAHLTAGNLIVGAGAILAPLGGGWIAAHHGIRLLFLICMGLSAAAAVWVGLFVREPRKMAVLSGEEDEPP